MGTDEQVLSIRVDCCIYSKNAVLSVAYHYSDTFFVSVDQGDKIWVIGLRPRKHDIRTPEDIRNRFFSDLVDHQLRQELEEIFHPIRELIVSKAFGKMD